MAPRFENGWDRSQMHLHVLKMAHHLVLRCVCDRSQHQQGGYHTNALLL